MTLFRGINVVSIAVPDLEQARDFYGNTLGLGSPVYDLPEANWIEEPIMFPGFVVFCSFHDPFGNKLQMCSPAPAEGASAG